MGRPFRVECGNDPHVADNPKRKRSRIDTLIDALVWLSNINRRHLSNAQRTTLAKKLLAEESKRAKARMRVSKGQGIKVAPTGATLKDKGKATAKVAKAVGTSARSAERATTIDKIAGTVENRGGCGEDQARRSARWRLKCMRF